MDLVQELVKLSATFNQWGVKYLVVGGAAVIFHGYFRTTHDIDLLIDSSGENVEKIKGALAELYGAKEATEIENEDAKRYMVLRFAPENRDVVIDFLGKIGPITFETASKDRQPVVIDGVEIPLCGLSTLIETKRGLRPKDQEDLLFLLGKKEYLEKHSPNNS